MADESAEFTPPLSAEATLRKFPVVLPHALEAGVPTPRISDDVTPETSVPSEVDVAPMNTRQPAGIAVARVSKVCV